MKVQTRGRAGVWLVCLVLASWGVGGAAATLALDPVDGGDGMMASRTATTTAAGGGVFSAYVFFLSFFHIPLPPLPFPSSSHTTKQPSEPTPTPPPHHHHHWTPSPTPCPAPPSPSPSSITALLSPGTRRSFALGRRRMIFGSTLRRGRGVGGGWIGRWGGRWSIGFGGCI